MAQANQVIAAHQQTAPATATSQAQPGPQRGQSQLAQAAHTHAHGHPCPQQTQSNQINAFGISFVSTACFTNPPLPSQNQPSPEIVAQATKATHEIGRNAWELDSGIWSQDQSAPH